MSTPQGFPPLPTFSPPNLSPIPVPKKKVVNGKININTAWAEGLMNLPGIGTSFAGRIITYRETKGPFQKIEDILKVSGIKSHLFTQERAHVHV